MHTHLVEEDAKEKLKTSLKKPNKHIKPMISTALYLHMK